MRTSHNLGAANERARQLIGKSFYALTVISVIDDGFAVGSRGACVLCQCSCGNNKETFVKYLKRGQVKTCGGLDCKRRLKK